MALSWHSLNTNLKCFLQNHLQELPLCIHLVSQQSQLQRQIPAQWQPRGRIAKLPVIGVANGIAGALLGGCKALFGAFVVLYVILFFPIPGDLRTDLRHSALVSLVTQPDRSVDDAVRGLMPWFVRPIVNPFFDRHHV